MKTRNSFRFVETGKKKFEIYRTECSYIKPVKFAAGLIDDVDKSTQLPVKAVHVPLVDQLRIYFEIFGVFKKIMDYEAKINQ